MRSWLITFNVTLGIIKQIKRTMVALSGDRVNHGIQHIKTGFSGERVKGPCPG